MCMMKQLSEMKLEPDAECMLCPVDRECTELVLAIAFRCKEIGKKLHQAGKKLEGTIQEH